MSGKMGRKLLIIIAFSLLYGVYELFMSLRQSHERGIVTSGDRLSLWIIFISIAVGYLVSFVIGSTELGRIDQWPSFFLIGYGLMVIGIIIRIIAILTLHRHFTYTVTTLENHELIETGLYKRIRHPGYLGLILFFLGVATSLSNWLSILSMIVPVLLGFIYRIAVEEKFMLKQMGQKYLDYQNRTNSLIPMIY